MKQPTEEITIYMCDDHFTLYSELEEDNLCDFDLASGKFAWVDEGNQHLSHDGKYGEEE